MALYLVGSACGCVSHLPRSGLVVRAQSPTTSHSSAFPGYAGGPQFPHASHAQPRAASSAIAQSPLRPVRLKDAITLALSKSNVVRVLNGDVALASATAFDTQIAEAELAGKFGAFDTRFKAAYEGSQIDQPSSSFFGPGIETETRRDETEFSAELSRKWRSGTTTSLGYAPPLAYLYFPRGDSGFNPAHSAEFLLKVEQPLLQGAWEDVNSAPIRIAQTQVDQTRWDVLEATQSQVRSVEEAYWHLNAAYVELQAIERVLPLAAESVRIETLRMQAEQSIYSDVARAEVQLERLRQQYLDAWFKTRRRSFQLRQLIGLSPRDGSKLIPVDVPVQTPPQLDFDSIVAAALQERPDLIQRRLGLQVREQQLLVADNQVKPELNVSAAYRVAGLSDRLDQSFDQVGGFDYEDWTLGMTFAMPFENRRAISEREVTTLRLARDRAILDGIEQRVVFQLAELISEITSEWRRFESRRRQLEQTEKWLKVARLRYSNPPDVGQRQDWLLLALRDYQSAIESHVSAVSGAGSSLARYNVLLAKLAELQGTNLERWSIRLGGNSPVDSGGAEFTAPGYTSFDGSAQNEFVPQPTDAPPLSGRYAAPAGITSQPSGSPPEFGANVLQHR